MELAADPTLRGFSDIRSIAGLALGEELLALIDLDAPVDLLSLRAKDRAVVGAAHLVDEAHFAPEKLAPKLRSAGPGRWKIELGANTAKVRCELWRATAPVGYRILCGAEADDLAQAAPFLLGRLAKQPVTSDVRFESSHQPLQDALGTSRAKPGEEAAKPESPADEQAQRWVQSIATADSVALDLTFLERDVEVGFELNYLEADTSGAFRSWLSAAPHPLPPEFWQSLACSPLVVASPGTDEPTMQELFSDATNPLRCFLAELSANSGVTPELAERMSQATGGFIPEHLRFTLASGGSLASGALHEWSHATAPPGRTGTVPAWHLWGFAGSGERYKAGFEVLLEASSANRSAASAAQAPKLVSTRLEKRPADLPVESILLRQDLANKSTTFGWILPMPDWTWLLIASTRHELVTQARRMLPCLSQPAVVDAAARTAFGRQQPLVALSFSLAGLQQAFAGMMPKFNAAALPFGGSTRVFAWVTGKRQPSERGALFSLALWSRWSPAASADLIELIKARAKSSRDDAHE